MNSVKMVGMDTLDIKILNKNILNLLEIKRHALVSEDDCLKQVGIAHNDYEGLGVKEEEYIIGALKKLQKAGYIDNFKFNDYNAPENFLSQEQYNRYMDQEAGRGELPDPFEITLSNDFEKLYGCNSELNDKPETKDQEYLPLFIGKDEDIFVKRQSSPFIRKARNKKYYFIRGCIERSNSDELPPYVLIEDLFSYLLEIDKEGKFRFSIKKGVDKYQYIRLTLNNIVRSEKKIPKYIKLDKATKKKILWIIKNKL